MLLLIPLCVFKGKETYTKMADLVVHPILRKWPDVVSCKPWSSEPCPALPCLYKSSLTISCIS